ncbi:PHD-finger family protein [Aphelenchoides avenae]|nr:PHD-finger family protein [Aphelenchus avenae]
MNEESADGETSYEKKMVKDEPEAPATTNEHNDEQSSTSEAYDIEEKMEPMEVQTTTESTSPKSAKSFISPGAQSAKSTDTVIDVDIIYREPGYAEICSFFNVFSGLLSMNPIPFTTIEKMFTTFENGKVDRELIDLHIQLMRKIWLKNARVERFEASLQKFCSTSRALDDECLQLERFGYANLPPATKLTILKALCECQFDCNVKFRENIFNTYQAFEIRLTPIGSDKNGLSYYFQKDCELNIRVFTVEPDDMSGGTWSLKAKSENQLALLIAELKDPEFGKKLDDNNDEEIDEDQLLGNASGGTEVKAEPGMANEKKPLVATEIEMTPEEMEKIQLFTKKNTLIDQFRDGKDLNKRKLEKEARKKGNSETAAIDARPVTSKSAKEEADAEEEDEKKHEDEDKIPEELLHFSDDDRKILPRRSARNAALTNIKAFVSTPQRKPRSSNTTPKKDAADKKSSQQTAVGAKCCTSSTNVLKESSDQGQQSSNATENEFDDDEDEESEENSSDDEFKLAEKKAKGTGGRRRRRRASAGRTPASGLGKKRGRSNPKVQQVTFMEESSDEEQEEEDVKERKKATEETLCMQCRSSKRPDLLLLCDMCDDAWHTWCLKPALWFVPDGDWFCPKCHHSMLIQKLSYALIRLREEAKTRDIEHKKKEAAAERLKREMDYIGVSLNNIIPSKTDPEKHSAQESTTSTESDDEVDGERQRRSKKRALKKFGGHREKFYEPVITIAEGRSRRTLNKVDYNFHAYDEQLQEAMDDESSNKPGSPVSGLGRGKDMQNIIEAENKRKSSADNTENTEPAAKPPTKRSKKHKKLTDLDIDNATESDTTSYKATRLDFKEGLRQNGFHLVRRKPRSPSRPRTNTCLRNDERVAQGRHSKVTRTSSTTTRRATTNRQAGSEKVAEQGVVAHAPRTKGRFVAAAVEQRRVESAGGSLSNARRLTVALFRRYSESDESSPESEEELELSDASSSAAKPRKRGGRASAKKSKWAPKGCSDEDEELEAVDSGSSEGEAGRTDTGRPLRRAAAEMKKKIQEKLASEDEDEEEEAKAPSAKISKRPVGALTRPRRVIADDDDDEADEFKPDEEEENEEEEDEEETEAVADEEEEDDEEPPTLVQSAKKDVIKKTDTPVASLANVPKKAAQHPPKPAVNKDRSPAKAANTSKPGVGQNAKNNHFDERCYHFVSTCLYRWSCTNSVGDNSDSGERAFNDLYRSYFIAGSGIP